MKAKITRGSGFCGLIDYVFDIGKDATHDKDARQIGGNMAGKGKPQALVAEFAALRRLRPDAERPVWHSSLRLPPGETLSDDKWNDIAIDYLKRLGIDPDNHPYIVVTHNDSHIHIVSSRIGFDGSLYYGRNEHLIATRITQELERAYGLTLTKGPTYDENGKIVRPDRSKLTRGELKMSKRTGCITPRQRLQEIITQAIQDRPTQALFEKRLTEAGVSYRLSSNGYGYQLDGVAFKGSQLGSAFKWTQLKKLLVLPEQEITKEPVAPQLSLSEGHQFIHNQQQAIRAARTEAWEAERKRRSRYHANRHALQSVGWIASRSLPQPLGVTIKIATELVQAIAACNDWMQAHRYRQHVVEVTARLNQVKAERAAIAVKIKSQNIFNGVADPQPTSKQSMLSFPRPEAQPSQQSRLEKLERIREIAVAIRRANNDPDAVRRLTTAATTEIQSMQMEAAVKLDKNPRGPSPAFINDVAIDIVIMDERRKMQPSTHHTPTRGIKR